MAVPKNEMISRRQYFFIIIQTLIGVGVLTLPYNLHQAAKQDGWISLLIAGILIQVVLVIFWGLASRFPQDHLFEYVNKIIGKFIGTLANVGLILYALSVAMVILLLFDEMIRTWLLHRTPYWIISLIFIFLSVYLVSDRIKVIARLYVFVSLLLPILVIFLLFASKDGHWIYLFPIGNSGVENIIKGVYQSTLSLLGYLMALLLFPYTEGTSKQKLGTISLANAFVVSFYLFTVIAAFIYFGTKEMDYVGEPVLYMLKAVELPVISRIDMFFISIWIISVATTLCSYILLASKGIEHLFKRVNHTWSSILTGVILFFVVFFTPKDESTLQVIDDYVSIAGIVFGLLFPIVLFLLSLLFKKKNKGASQYDQNK